VNAAENQTAVTDVDATDPDAGALLPTQFGGRRSRPVLDRGRTAVLTFQQPRDFETFTDANADGIYEVEVTAATPGRTDVQLISVTVTNVNEARSSAPTAAGTASVNAAENQTAVTDGGRHRSGCRRPAHYTISGGADQACSRSWPAPACSLQQPARLRDLHRCQRRWHLRGRSHRQRRPGGTDVQLISVTVTNVNEAPVISSNGGGATASVNAAENQTAVTDVDATDPDAGALLTYTISGGADQGLFSIRGRHRRAHLQQPARLRDLHRCQRRWHLRGRSHRQRRPGRHRRAVDQRHGHQRQRGPVISSNGGGATASVNAAENQTAVTDVDATDPDAGALLTYTISAAPIKACLDRGRHRRAHLQQPRRLRDLHRCQRRCIYEVEVTVSDGLGGTDVQLISVTVTNVNEAPVISSNGGGPPPA